MERYRVSCSSKEFLNETVNEPRSVPLSIACVRIGEYDTNCCVLMKDHVASGEDWIPEPVFRKR